MPLLIFLACGIDVERFISVEYACLQMLLKAVVYSNEFDTLTFAILALL
jgi:hypothetical protein